MQYSTAPACLHEVKHHNYPLIWGQAHGHLAGMKVPMWHMHTLSNTRCKPESITQLVQLMLGLGGSPDSLCSLAAGGCCLLLGLLHLPLLLLHGAHLNTA